MVFQEELNFWCQMGVGRQSELARQLGVTRAYINNTTNQCVPISKDQEDRFKRVMKRVEQRESKLKRSVLNNLTKCASMTQHCNKEIAKTAKEKVVYWSEIYGGFK